MLNVDTPQFSLKSNDSFAHQYSRSRVLFQITQVQEYQKYQRYEQYE